ncbi:tetratricopeptide repeat protein [Actinoplanes sp. RD1]|uniref:tetratricopeptide repeat protein n=1 Tax=Actinoplanes sp. RD1 TaxID=3064538 RepID=UPI0027409347|nr:tetratricopeptide repeat protein [Actinoplanes sp. RD1]
MSPAPRPYRTPWMATALIAVGSVTGGIASNIVANRIGGDLGTVAWIITGAGVLAGVLAAVLATADARSRRARGTGAVTEPPPAVPVQEAWVPTNLPDTVGFVGRREVVDRLAVATRTRHAVALVGRRGVGTSACVVQAANEVRRRYPDGQLYLDLRKTGRNGSIRALRPREVLDALCRTIGIDETALHQAAGLDAATTLLSAGLGERKMLLVLDNVDSPEQVLPLLPPARRCRLLLAGGPAVAALEGVDIHQVAEPSAADAAELFTAAARAAGCARPGLGADPDVREIVELAGRQPHAVRVLGSWLAAQNWSPPELLKVVRHGLATGRVDATLTLLTSRDHAYAALPAGTRRLIRLLALVPQPLSRNAVAALTGTNRGHTDRLVHEAAGSGFVTETPDGRYQLRPLLVSYCRAHLLCDEPPWRAKAAQLRLVRYLARQAERSADAIVPDQPAGADPGGGWFRRHETLLHVLVCEPWGSWGSLPARPSRRMRRWWLRLAVALCTYYASAGRLDDWAAVCVAVLKSPMVRHSRAVAGWAHNELGAVYRWQGDPHRAAVELTAAVALRHRRGAAQSRTNLGLALLDQGDADAALDQLQRARQQRSPRDRAGQALTDLGLGVASLIRAKPEPRFASRHLIRAANQFQAIGDRRGYAAALTNLALAQWQLGERLDAAQAWSAALDCYPAVGDQPGHAAALLNAGAILAAGAAEQGDRRRAARARDLLEQSLAIREAERLPTGRTLLSLGDVALLLQGPDQARKRWEEALEACDKAGDTAGGDAAGARLRAGGS